MKALLKLFLLLGLALGLSGCGLVSSAGRVVNSIFRVPGRVLNGANDKEATVPLWRAKHVPAHERMA